MYSNRLATSKRIHSVFELDRWPSPFDQLTGVLSMIEVDLLNWLLVVVVHSY